MNLNAKQIISIIGAVLSILMVSSAQLTDLMGAGAAKSIVSAAGLVNMILGSVMAAISGTMPQQEQVKQVLAMPGVEKIDVNRNASPELAKLAVDPNVDKISATPEAQITVSRTAAAA